MGSPPASLRAKLAYSGPPAGNGDPSSGFIKGRWQAFGPQGCGSSRDWGLGKRAAPSVWPSDFSRSFWDQVPKPWAWRFCVRGFVVALANMYLGELPADSDDLTLPGGLGNPPDAFPSRAQRRAWYNYFWKPEVRPFLVQAPSSSQTSWHVLWLVRWPGYLVCVLQ